MLAFLLAALVLLAAALVISYPLIFHALEPYRAAPPPDAAYSEPDALLEALGELEVSYGTGKISEQDYQAEKLRLEKRYLEVADQPASAGGNGTDAA